MLCTGKIEITGKDINLQLHFILQISPFQTTHAKYQERKGKDQNSKTVSDGIAN